MRYRLEWWTGSQWETVAFLSVSERPLRTFATALGRKTFSPHLADRLRANRCPDEARQPQIYTVDPITREIRAA